MSASGQQDPHLDGGAGDDEAPDAGSLFAIDEDVQGTYVASSTGLVSMPKLDSSDSDATFDDEEVCASGAGLSKSEGKIAMPPAFQGDCTVGTETAVQ